MGETREELNIYIMCVCTYVRNIVGEPSKQRNIYVYANVCAKHSI